jgi:hypothetical protein
LFLKSRYSRLAREFRDIEEISVFVMLSLLIWLGRRFSEDNRLESEVSWPMVEFDILRLVISLVS